MRSIARPGPKASSSRLPPYCEIAKLHPPTFSTTQSLVRRVPADWLAVSECSSVRLRGTLLRGSCSGALNKLSSRRAASVGRPVLPVGSRPDQSKAPVESLFAHGFTSSSLYPASNSVASRPPTLRSSQNEFRSVARRDPRPRLAGRSANVGIAPRFRLHFARRRPRPSWRPRVSRAGPNCGFSRDLQPFRRDQRLYPRQRG